jgi:hypothetical protein
MASGEAARKCYARRWRGDFKKVAGNVYKVEGSGGAFSQRWGKCVAAACRTLRADGAACISALFEDVFLEHQ